MTLFLSLRIQTIAGGVKPAAPYDGNEHRAPNLNYLSVSDFVNRCRDRNVLFAVHGFNVPQAYGMRSLCRLEKELKLDPANETFVGVLWPGDAWIPAVNYPFEGATAIQCGINIAKFCNEQLAPARSISFASHSLGARVVLEATRRLQRKDGVRSLCLTAGAINSDCLAKEYAAATGKAQGAATLASRWDMVLKLAYPLGDPLANFLHDDHAYGTAALGREGPNPRPASVEASQIPDEPVHYGHGNYLPPSAPQMPANETEWIKVADYVRRTFRNPHERWK